MERKSKLSKEQKIEIVKCYIDGKGSFLSLAKKFSVGRASIDNWVRKYQKYGEAAFDPRPKNNSYTKEFKERVVQAYLNGEGSLPYLAVKYDIPSNTTIRNWLKRYNSHIEQKDYIPTGDVYMTKSRKTTKEERIEIVKYCIDHDKDYKLAAKVYEVPYANVYQWVQKFIKDGNDGLNDKRGHHKKEEELDELTLLKRRLERAERERDIALMENRLLKKVDEIERRRFGERAVMRQNTKLSKKRPKN